MPDERSHIEDPVLVSIQREIKRLELRIAQLAEAVKRQS